ncbi:hypothetical protein NDU88_004339 [Pleurodeles waltl]|uniref:Secreted protein n=1 Tax=Pleurodeles waltl TaxID=8319 RepID=A0AAV7TR67_PLEWA|nr:hypothetical protein NDU88_004339 [Pleurodeles waltl]
MLCVSPLVSLCSVLCMTTSAGAAEALGSPLCSASDAAVGSGLLQPFVSLAPSVSQQSCYWCSAFSRCDRCVFSVQSRARSLHPGLRARCCGFSRYGAMHNVAIGGDTMYGRRVPGAVLNPRPAGVHRCGACLRCDGLPLSRAGG